MSVHLKCDDCKASLDNEPRIMIPQMILVNKLHQGQVQGLHFCDRKCLNSWLIKHENMPPNSGQPQILRGPNG